MITWTSIPILFHLISSISGTIFIHEDSLAKAMDELLGMFNCSLDTQKQIQKCLYGMYDDINDYKTWHSPDRVHCCIVAKFQDCVMEGDDESCMTGAGYMTPRTVLTDTRTVLIETRTVLTKTRTDLTDTSCADYDQDSFQCHLFFNHITHFLPSLGVFLPSLGILFVVLITSLCLASRPKPATDTSATVTPAEVRTGCVDLPPSYDNVHLNFSEKLQKF